MGMGIWSWCGLGSGVVIGMGHAPLLWCWCGSMGGWVYGMIWYEYAKRISNAKGFSLVNELRIIKKVNLLKFSTSWGVLGDNI